ncbi:MAG: secondary thiamine-phosphate synthase enzyme [Candidatus Buchananbacteria bacterium CG10_big_fil_rev_8_21_14_0_10_42_9]|uniref:Secondary thiamine-phosphate synthase enzyme n=1 Tax=Candidatus Buchananbacteria bacterium CG10_big_fil_rev_8_21_14_0_10_42_9 TaxID=1974526 RepID=A0A2H0W2D9_9BACT|nr:MAG: secondary thiamine-phosphate synthase enzyme [Candidatus Buchananbacteria bacterium CG10_big_fil_rev_8_21_14_0_10_42_9]
MKFTVTTKGHYDFIDITPQVAEAVSGAKVKSGIVLVFVAASTAAITTMEYEEGIIHDLISLFEAWAPEKSDYEHHQKWGDANGAAHMKSAIIGTDQSIPVENGELKLGTWQQIVLIDFDEKPRNRDIIVKVI